MNEPTPPLELVSSGHWCPTCGARVPPDASEGLCSSCLLQAGLLGFPDEDAASAEAGPGALALLHDFGDFELLAELGRGGMGVVYKARQKSLHRLVALKMIQSGRLACESDLRRFRTEAEAAARLHHPNIVAVHEVGAHEGQHYFTMDFVEGRSLAELVREGPLPARQAAAHLHAIAGAVQHAHERGVLHRDLKPSNILMDAAGQARVTDFGLAKLLEDGAEVTCSGAVVGSPGYMSPEQAAGQASHASVRSDVYALGAILYDLVCARPPFQADTALETMRLVQQTEPVPPRLLNPRLPRDLETISLKCLQKDPAKRYATARELADDLGRFLRDEPIRARPVSRAEKLWRWCRRNPALAISLTATLGLLVAVVVGASIVAQQFHRTSERAVAAERDAKEELWAAYLAQARAGRLSGVVGRRRESLAAIAAAAEMRPSLELRNEAIAALALTDVEPPVTVHPGEPANRNGGSVFDVDFTRYAAIRERGGVRVCAVEDQRVLADLATPHLGRGNGAFSPDGRFLFATSVAGAVFLWDLSVTPPVAHTNFPPVCDAPRSATFSPDSRTFAVAGRDGLVHFYDLSASPGDRGAQDPRFEIRNGQRPPLTVGAVAYRIDFDPSGQRLAVMIGGEVQLWDLVQRIKTTSLTRPIDGVVMDWHPDGRHLAAGFNNGELWLWDTESGEARPLPGHTQYVSSVAFDPLGVLVVTDSWDSQTLFWDAATGRLLSSRHLGLSCQFSRDGQWLGIRREEGGLDRARVVRTRVFRQLTSASLKSPHHSGVDASHDGRWMAFGGPTGWVLWDPDQGRQVAYVPDARGGRLKFHPDGRSVITFTSDQVLQWPLEAASNSSAVRVGAAKVLLSVPGSQFQSVSLSADGGLLAVAGIGRSLLVDLGEPRREMPFAEGHLTSLVVLHPEKRWAAVAAAGTGVTVWDAHTGRFLRDVLTNEDACIALSPDGRTLATSSVRECCWWDTDTWQVRRRFPTDLAGHAVGQMVFSPDNRFFALAAGRQKLVLFDLPTGSELATLTAPVPQNNEPLAFSGDGGLLAAATTAGVVQLWDLRALRRELAALGLDW